MPSLNSLKKDELVRLADRLDIEHDDDATRQDIIDAIDSKASDEELDAAFDEIEEEDKEAAASQPADSTEEREDVDASGADIGVASTAGSGNDEEFANAPEDEPQERREVTNPEGESVFVTVLGETDEGTAVREDGTMRRFVI